jgi:GAF domain
MTAAPRRRAALSDRLLFDQRLFTQGEASRNKSRGGWGFLGYQPPRSLQVNDKLRPTRRYSLHICAAMDNHDPLDQQRLPGDHAFAELGKMVLGNQSVDETLRHVADLVRQTLPMIDEVSVTLMNDETAETVVFTGPLAVHLDERQYESGFGPCLDAALSGETIIVDMSADHSPYPDFASACRRSGITHTASVGLPIPQQVVGALNLYSSAPDPPDEKSMAWVKASRCTPESP